MSKLRADYPLTMRNAVSAEFLQSVRDRIKNEWDDFLINRGCPSRRFLMFPDNQYQTEKRMIADHFKFGNWQIDPKYTNFIGNISRGSGAHPHLDHDIPGHVHIRANVLINKAEGVNPIMDTVQLSMDVGDVWLNIASRVVHYTTANQTDKPRSIISFGYQVPISNGDSLYATYMRWHAKALEG